MPHVFIYIYCILNSTLQSSEALEFLKRDLTEFSTVVQHDTACSLVATANAVKNKLAVSLNIFPHNFMNANRPIYFCTYLSSCPGGRLF